MRDHYNEFKAKGADVVSIGMGWPEMAAGFRDSFSIPFPLLVDQEKKTYRALEIKRGSLMEIAGPQVWLRATKNILSGNPPVPTRLDVRQLGGAAVVDKGGELLLLHRSATSEDNVSVEQLLAALP